jgi:polyhydroxyalkanoate synthesis regulator phasin
MPANEGFRKYVEAGAVLGQITRARAEEIVRELVGAGEVQRGQAQQWVDDLMERSRRASEELLHLVRSEVSNQLEALGLDPEELAKQVAEVLKHSAGVGRKATTAAAGTASSTMGRTAAAAKQAAARATGTRKAAKRAPAPKPPDAKTATKATTTKAGASKAGATKAAPKKVAAKKSAPRKAPAKKAAPRKAPAKKAAGPSSGTGH